MNAILSDAFDIEKLNEGIAFGFSEIVSKAEAEIERKVEETAKAIFEKLVDKARFPAILWWV